ncbi:MAG TPA: GH25 family lysozyme [Oscillospiraceae bacterium]|nr:hypothetical protein [Oscillospiraceae bacterium]HNW04946.1 GH25 family lysozyme [Oscillospiraceae bacterium]HPV99808.1 GH25 family lysozyme [Oscillospiraceae bacterium]
MTTFDGVDVSKYQGTIDWAKAAESGVQFAILRASIGNAADPMLKANLAGCAAAGIPVGFYHFCKSADARGAREEGAVFLEAIAGAKPEYPIFCDIELAVQTALSAAEQMEIADAFFERALEQGYLCGIYSFKANLEKILASEAARLKKYEIWCAQWAGKNALAEESGLWQRSSKGVVPGIGTVVDLNTAYKDYPALVRERGKNGFPKQEPEDPCAVLRAERDALAEKLRKIAEILG